MHKYELVCIVHPDLDENAFNGVIEKVRVWIGEAGGSVDKIEIWGRRRMAYHIRKQREGQYVLAQAEFAPAFAAVLERNLRFLEPVMRFLITAVE